MAQENARRFAAWIHCGRFRRFFLYFPMFTLSCLLVQFLFVRFGMPDLGWSFPLLFGIAMGLTFALWLPKSITDSLRRIK